MKTLKIENLVNYLPFDLKMQVLDTKTIFTLKEFLVRDGEIRISGYGECLPILKPLYELPKFGSNGYFNSKKIVDLYNVDKDTNHDPKWIKYYVHRLTYSDLENLYKNHFNIFCLIESGLAIDFNKA